MKITREQIFEAAAALAAETGKVPTVSAVREHLGAGSFTTITEVMREWREAQKPEAAPQLEALPQVVTDRLAAMGRDLWAAATAAAAETVAAERAELETVKAELYEQNREAAEYADKLDATVDQMSTKVDELTFAVESERIAHEGTRKLLLVETEEKFSLTAKLETSETSAQRLQLQYDRAAEEVKTLNDAYRKEATEAARLKGLVEALEDKAEQLRLSVRSHREDADKAEAEAKAARTEAAELRGEVAALQKQLAQQAELIAKMAAGKPEAAPRKTTKGKEGPSA